MLMRQNRAASEGPRPRSARAPSARRPGPRPRAASTRGTRRSSPSRRPSWCPRGSRPRSPAGATPPRPGGRPVQTWVSPPHRSAPTMFRPDRCSRAQSPMRFQALQPLGGIPERQHLRRARGEDAAVAAQQGLALERLARERTGLLGRAAADRELERGQAGQRARSGAGAARPVAVRVQARQLGRVDHAEEDADQLDRLQPVAQILRVRRQLRGGAHGQLDRLAGGADEEQDPAEPGGGLTARDGVRQAVVGLAQVLDRRRAADVLRGLAELERERGALIGRRRLGLRALEVVIALSGVPRSTAIAAASRSRSTTHGVAARRRGESWAAIRSARRSELVSSAPRAHARARAARRRARHRPRRAPAGARTRAARRGAGSRRATSASIRLGRRRLVDPGQRGDRRQAGLLAQHGDGARDRRGGRGSRASRSSTVRDTARGPIARTEAACSASGATCSAASAVSSWRRSSGLPAVTS